jgi:hypothetical protein
VATVVIDRRRRLLTAASHDGRVKLSRRSTMHQRTTATTVPTSTALIVKG